MTAPSDPFSALDTCCDPLVVISNQGAVIWHNSAAERMWQLNTRKISALAELVGPESTARILSTKYSATMELHLKNALVQDTPLACSVIDIGSGAPGGAVFLAIFQPFTPDSTKLAKHEDFLATVAHDLKNPLGAIFGYADALIDTSLSQGLNDKQREVIQRIRATAFRTLELVRNFQHLAQLQSAKSFATTIATDLNQAIQAVVDSTWRPSSAAATMKVLLAPEPVMVRVERVQLERIVSNLINNALKFAPPDGTVTIRSFSNDSNGHGFDVHNTGSYIPPEEVEGVFEKYKRASTGKGIPGSGLGLFIVKSILDAIGGSVKVKSSIQDGTSFSVRFPK